MLTIKIEAKESILVLLTSNHDVSINNTIFFYWHIVNMKNSITFH